MWYFLIVLTIALWSNFCFGINQLAVITVPVADIRADKVAITEFKLPILPPSCYGTNPLYGSDTLKSQALFGELVEIKNKDNDWVYITALEQTENVNNKWQYLSGYVKTEQIEEIQDDAVLEYYLMITSACAPVSEIESNESIAELGMGSRANFFGKVGNYYIIFFPELGLTKIAQKDAKIITKKVEETEKEIRENIIKYACNFKDNLYNWDGRSVFSQVSEGNKQITGPDCSGLTNLAYRTCGLTIPRMSYDQFLASNSKIIESGKDLKPADLIFLADATKNPPRVGHVVMYLGDGLIIESQASIKPYTTRIIKGDDYERFGGFKLADIKNGQTITYFKENIKKEIFVYFGSYLYSPENVQNLRDAFFNFTLPK